MFVRDTTKKPEEKKEYDFSSNIFNSHFVTFHTVETFTARGKNYIAITTSTHVHLTDDERKTKGRKINVMWFCTRVLFFAQFDIFCLLASLLI